MATFAVVTDTRSITHPEGRPARFLSQSTGGVCEGITGARKFGSLAAASGLMLQRGPGSSGIVAFDRNVPGLMSVVLTSSALDHILERVWLTAPARALFDRTGGPIEIESL